METFSASLAICAGNSPVNFPHKGQWREALMFSLIYAWINDWVNNREAGDLRRQHGHYDVIVMPAANLDHFDSSWPGDAKSIAVKNIVVNIHIGSGNGFVPKRCQVIPWTNADLILPLVRNFSVIRMKIQTFALKKMHFNMPFAKWRPFCWGIIVLIYDQFTVCLPCPSFRTQLQYKHKRFGIRAEFNLQTTWQPL